LITKDWKETDSQGHSSGVLTGLAPSNFFLFDLMKAQLAARTFELAHELVEQTCAMASAFRCPTLEIAFLEWEERP
jgi:hypothetical protein